ncbi:MAG: hypothetical protein ACRDL0_00825 [Thermoleophilaceae bacterium]
MVRVRASDDRYAWLCDAAAEHKPPLSTDELLRQLVDQAIAEGKAAVCCDGQSSSRSTARAATQSIIPTTQISPGDSLTSRRPDDSLEIERPRLAAPAEP